MVKKKIHNKITITLTKINNYNNYNLKKNQIQNINKN